MALGQSQVNLHTKDFGTRASLLTINKFAKMCRTTPRTLRFYEKKSLIKPAYIDEYNRYRYYKPTQVRDFQKIRLLTNFHVRLGEISNRAHSKKLDGFLDERLGELGKQMIELKKEHEFLKRMEYFMSTKNVKQLLKKEKVGPYDLFCWRIDDANYYKITQYILDLQKFCKKRGIDFHPYHQITIYVDSDYNPQKSKLEITFKTKTDPKKIKNLPENYYFKKYPKTDALVYTYQGPYEYLELVYEKLGYFFWILRKEKYPFCLEIYKQGVLNKISKYDYITKIAVPLS